MDPTVVHFEIPAENVEKLKGFYEKVFGWKIDKWDGSMEYWMVDTGKGEPGINGGIMKKTKRGETTINTIGVDSVDEFIRKIESNGGKVLMKKTAIPGVGWMAYCADTESNKFGIMQNDKSAR